MLQRVTTLRCVTRQLPLCPSVIEGQARRGLATSRITAKEAAAASSSTAPPQSSSNASAKPAAASASGPATPSSCPAGTVLSGLSLYKDRADPVALPDSEYPDWLWNILDDQSTTSASGAVLESTAGLSKGEARAVQKRNMKAVRAAQKGKGKATEGPGVAGRSGAGAGMNSVGASSEGEVEGAGEAEKAQGVAAVKVELATKRSAEAEKVAKKALRKASRDSIKAKNFITAR